MGKRVQGEWDLLWGQGTILVLLCLVFLAGGAAGCLYVWLAGADGAGELRDYLADYLSLAQSGALSRPLWELVWDELRELLLILLFSLTAIGVAVIPLVVMVRGFFLAFSVGCFCRVFGIMGLLPGLILFGLPALLWGPALFWAAFQGMSGSQALLRRVRGDSRCALPFGVRYWLRAGVCVALVLAGAGVEYGVVPVLLRAAARVML